MDTLLEQATREAAHRVIERWMREKMLRFSSYDDGSDDLILAAEIARWCVNAYEPLVKAMRQLLSLSYHYSGCESSYRVTTRCGCGHQEAREKAFAALAIVTESDSGTLVESSPEREGGE